MNRRGSTFADLNWWRVIGLTGSLVGLIVAWIGAGLFVVWFINSAWSVIEGLNNANH